MELARLTRQRLIIIPMHENFETSDLIGSWRPTTSKTQNHPLFDKIDLMFKQIIKMLVLIIMPLLSKTSNNEVFTKFKNILRQRIPISGSNRYEMIPYETEALKELVTLLNRLAKVSQLSNDAKVLISCYARQTDYYANKLKNVRMDGNQEMSFTFVESEFIQAIREGWWVLLDNINSAPPEVLERLNSLTEDNPMLSLYENSNGQLLTQNNGIHSNFRLFTMANLNRIYSNKLSSAFLNRVIRIWLPPVDECDLTIDSDLTTTDLSPRKKIVSVGISNIFSP
jgi:midasin